MESFDPRLLSVDGDSAQLHARTCRACGATTLVARDRCAVCQEPTEIATLTGGTVVHLCEAQFPLHGLTPPVQIAQVRCEPSIDLVGVCTEQVREGDAVVLAPLAVQSSEGTSAGYAFRPAVTTTERTN